MLATKSMGDYDQLQVRSERQTVSGLREGKRCDIYVCATIRALHSAYMNYTALRLHHCLSFEVSKIIFIRNDFKWFRIIRCRIRYLSRHSHRTIRYSINNCHGYFFSTGDFIVWSLEWWAINQQVKSASHQKELEHIKEECCQDQWMRCSSSKRSLNTPFSASALLGLDI